MGTVVWYRVRDLDGARAFYKETLGFEETFVDFDDRWAQLQHGGTAVAIAEGEPEEEGGVRLRRLARMAHRRSHPAPARHRICPVRAVAALRQTPTAATDRNASPGR